MNLYALRNVFDKQPLQIATTVMGWLNLIVIAGWWSPGEKVVSGLNTALVSTLFLFVSSKTANKAVLNELADK